MAAGAGVVSGVAAAASAVEDADTDQMHLLRDTIGLSADGAGHVRAVPIAISRVGVVIDFVDTRSRAPLELGLADADMASVLRLLDHESTATTEAARAITPTVSVRVVLPARFRSGAPPAAMASPLGRSASPPT